MTETEEDIWCWYHSVSEPYYHIQLTIKYRKSLIDTQVGKIIVETTKGFKERYAIEVFRLVPEMKGELWGGEFWTDGYYFAAVSGRGDKAITEKYIEKQGQRSDVRQLKLFKL